MSRTLFRYIYRAPEAILGDRILKQKIKELCTCTGGGGDPQTLQQVLTTGATLTQNNTIDLDSNQLIFSNGPISYGGDYSGDYSDRSLVDKGYVDSVIVGSTSLQGALDIGSTLNKNNNIDADGNDVSITNANAICLSLSGNGASFEDTDGFSSKVFLDSANYFKYKIGGGASGNGTKIRINDKSDVRGIEFHSTTILFGDEDFGNGSVLYKKDNIDNDWERQLANISGNEVISVNGEVADESGNIVVSAVILSDANGNTKGGDLALDSLTSGASNTAFGRRSLNKLTSGSENIAIGYLTLEENLTGDGNVAIGNVALNKNTTGEFITAIGYYAGQNHTTGANCVYIGAYAGRYETAAGSRIFLDTQDRGSLAGGRTGSPVYIVTNPTVSSQIICLNGKVGVNTSSPSVEMHVIGAGKFTSDVEITDFTKGIILTASDSSRWRVTVSTLGVLSATSI